jgi:hypothetical protein
MPRNVTITFDDGTSHAYQGVPDEVTPDQVHERATAEFRKPITNIDGGASAPVKAPPKTYMGALAEKANTPSEGLNDAFVKGGSKLALGALRGGADVGNTITNALINSGEYLKNKITPPSLTSLTTGDNRSDIAKWNDERSARLAQADKEAESMGMLYSGGRIAGNVAATAPVGALLAGSAKALGAGEGLVNSLATGGMRIGAPAQAAMGNSAILAAKALTNPLTRIAGGAATGGASVALVDPEHAGLGAIIGGAAPGVVKLAGMAGKAAYNGGKGLVEPFTQTGQDAVIARTLYRNAENPEAAITAMRNIDPALIKPTAAQASQDAGLANIEQTITGMVPGQKTAMAVRRAEQNAARTDELVNASGASGERALNEAMRKTTGDELYTKAFSTPINQNAITKLAKSEITSLLKNPYVQDILPEAKKLAKAENINLNNPSGSIQGLHYIKKSLDDLIEKAGQNGIGTIKKGQYVAAKQKLLGLMDKISPEYAAARAEYAAASKPIEQMTAIQELLTKAQTGSTDALQNIQLSPAAFRRPYQNRREALIKTLEPKQIAKLDNLYKDFGSATWARTAGKTAGSDTFSNLAQGNALTQMLGEKMGNSKLVSSTLGNLLKLPYMRSNQQMMETLGKASLSPEETLRLMELARKNSGIKVPDKILYPGSRTLLNQATYQSPNASQP